MENNKPDRTVIKLISTLTLITLIVILALQNSDHQNVKMFFWNLELPLFVLLFFCYLIGVVMMLIILYPRYRKASLAEDKIEKLREQINQLENKLSKQDSFRNNG